MAGDLVSGQGHYICGFDKDIFGSQFASLESTFNEICVKNSSYVVQYLATKVLK